MAERERAIIVDLDGTLALLNGRGPFEYHKCARDLINSPVKQVVVAYHQVYGKVIVVSGRADSCLDLTRDWLRRHDIPFADLFLRRTGDYRKDAIVKREIYEREIAPHYQIDFVLDDRDQSVAMWRKELGLPCFQVAYGNF